MTNDPQYPEFAERNSPEEDAANRLANAPRPTLSPNAKSAIRAQMLVHARQQNFSAQPLRPDFAPLLRWAVVASLTLVVMLTTAVPATFASVPGDILYPVKQRFEAVELSLVRTAPARANLHLAHAQRRIDEAAVLAQRDQLTDQIVYAALEQMAAAAVIARNEATLSAEDQAGLQSQTANLTIQLNMLLNDDDAPDQLVESVLATESSGALLLPMTPTATLIATQTATTAATLTPTTTGTFTPTATPSPTMISTETPADAATATLTPTPTLPIVMFVEGPIEAINGNIIVIYGIEHPIDPANPLLDLLEIGDSVRVIGDNIQRLMTETPDALGSEPNTADGIQSGIGQSGWQDTGDCSNPPPDHAPAYGWRARCEGQPNPGNSGGQGQSNNGNNGNNAGGQGRGNSDDDDD